MAEGPYINDADRIAQPMGQFMQWNSCLFWWSGSLLGWRYIDRT